MKLYAKREPVTDFSSFTDGDASFSEDSLLVAATPVGLYRVTLSQLFVTNYLYLNHKTLLARALPIHAIVVRVCVNAAT